MGTFGLADQEELSRQARQLSDWLDRWDPIGVYGFEDPQPPPGEYDCLVWPLLRRLWTGVGEAEIAAYLEHELDEHFGLGRDTDTRAVAQRLLAWWPTVAGGAQHVLPPRLAAALVQRGLLPAEETPWLAAHWLAGDLDGPALRALAGLPRGDPDVRGHWHAALSELGLPGPVEDADREALSWAARQVRAGEADPAWLVSGFWPDHDRPDADLDPLVHALAELLDPDDLLDPDHVRPRRRGWVSRLLRRDVRPQPEELAARAEGAIEAMASEDWALARRLLGVDQQSPGR